MVIMGIWLGFISMQRILVLMGILNEGDRETHKLPISEMNRDSFIFLTLYVRFVIV